MKKIFLTAFFLFSILVAKATEPEWYYAYFQTEYVQGPWSRTILFTDPTDIYLEPRMFLADNMGSDKIQLINEIFSTYVKSEPYTYNWKTDLSLQGDTLIIEFNSKVRNFERVKNELVTTFCHIDPIRKVVFVIDGKRKTYSMKDILIPYFELIKENGKEAKSIFLEDSILQPERMTEVPLVLKHDSTKAPVVAAPALSQNSGSEKDQTIHWLFYCLVATNCILLVYLILRIRKKKSDD